MGRSGYVDDIALCIDTELLLKPTHATNLQRVPDFVELGFVCRRGWLHDELLEAVFLAVLARMGPRDSLRAFARYGLRQISRLLAVVG